MPTIYFPNDIRKKSQKGIFNPRKKYFIISLAGKRTLELLFINIPILIININFRYESLFMKLSSLKLNTHD